MTCYVASAALWSDRLGYATKKSYSPTRFFGKFEIETSVCAAFGDVLPFVRDDCGPHDGLPPIAPDHRRSLLTQLNNPQRNAKLMLELAIVQDGTTELVACGFKQEGEIDDVILRTYDDLMAVRACLRNVDRPQTRAVATAVTTSL